MKTVYTNPAAPSTPRDEPTFAEQAAAAAFGRHYVAHADREFQDRPPPNWQKVGVVADGVVDRPRRQRDHDDRHLDLDVQVGVDHDMAEV